MSKVWITFSSDFKNQVRESVRYSNEHLLDNYLYCNGNSLEIDINWINWFFKDKHEDLRSSIRIDKVSFSQLKELWETLSDIPVDNNDCIEQNFLWWSAGTDKFDIWHWFDEQCPNNLHDDLMFPLK